MNILSFFVIIPAAMLLLLFVCRNIGSIRAVMVAGASTLWRCRKRSITKIKKIPTKKYYLCV